MDLSPWLMDIFFKSFKSFWLQRQRKPFEVLGTMKSSEAFEITNVQPWKAIYFDGTLFIGINKTKTHTNFFKIENFKTENHSVSSRLRVCHTLMAIKYSAWHSSADKIHSKSNVIVSIPDSRKNGTHFQSERKEYKINDGTQWFGLLSGWRF